MILADLDNVIAEFEPAYRCLINRLIRKEAVREDIREYSFAQSLGLTQEEDQMVWENFNAGNGWAQLAPRAGAADFMMQLVALDRVAIVTNRPVATREVTAQWLEKNRINYHELHVTENPSKSDYVLSLGWRPRIVVEDAWHHAAEFSKIGVPTVIFDYPWNRRGELEQVIRVEDYQEALAAVKYIFTRSTA